MVGETPWPQTRRRALVMLAAAGLVGVSLSGCDQLLFRKDNRIVITSPTANAHVRQPLTLTWVTQDFTPGRDGSFAIFIDADPIGPGASIHDLTVADRAQVHVQTAESLDLSTILRPRAVVDSLEQNHHDITVILLDPSGQRVGEEAGFAEFQVDQ